MSLWNVYIIEDDYFQKKRLSQAIMELYGDKCNICDDIDFNRFEEFIQGQVFTKQDIFFFDIDFSDLITGIDLAEKLRKKSLDCSIAFYTAYPDKSLEIIYRNILPVGIISKEHRNISNDLKSIMDKISYYNYQQESDYLSFCLNGRTLRIKTNDINYIETNKETRNWVTFKLKNSEKMINITMKQLRDEIDKNFFYKDLRSYIINFKEIQEIHKKSGYIHFIDDQKLYVGNKIIQKVIKAFDLWLTTNS
ncbi:LytR/AlgR family response regulator transcription factor [Enterococcus sp. UD-01]|jgi:DNA-binding LytR/AlgR family response regulator|uniref:LytR/AlgR family response regulator transcription factor n=1 Tax=Enterococcus sp. UD-01 TaxID=3373911 RepID=UPI0038323A54